MSLSRLTQTQHTHSVDGDAVEGVVWSINNKFKTNVKKVRWRPMNMFINKFQLESEVMVGVYAYTAQREQL